MICRLWIDSIAPEHIDTFRQFMQTEPWDGERFPMTFLNDALEDDPLTGSFLSACEDADYPMYLSDFYRVRQFFRQLAKAVPSLKMFVYGFLDRGDPEVKENAPPDYGGLFWIELFGDGRADSDLTPF